MTGPAIGRATRGTTGTNRLRRVDRWIARHPSFRRAAEPLVVDLGYGSSAVTTLELAMRLHRVRPDVSVRGLEIDPERVSRAERQLDEVRAGGTGFDPAAPVSFGVGGFEIPGDRPAVIRAMNVLRQYDEDEVDGAWATMAARLQPDGVLVEGTCDEIGRVATWIEVGPNAAPRTLTLSLRLAGLERPSIAAERLPKALIHRNVPGEGVHRLFETLDREWVRAAVVAPFGPVQRWRAALEAAASGGLALDGRSRWRLGEVSVPWHAVAPHR